MFKLGVVQDVLVGCCTLGSELSGGILECVGGIELFRGDSPVPQLGQNFLMGFWNVQEGLDQLCSMFNLIVGGKNVLLGILFKSYVKGLLMVTNPKRIIN